MTTQTVPDLKELFKQAAEIASHVPENMQVAAFNRAIDLLTGSLPSQTEPVPGKNPPPAATAPPSGSARRSAPAPIAADQLVDQIDSTQHPGVRTAAKVLDRALMVLQIALARHGVDGLSPGQIARILTDKFRVNTTDVAVRMALGGATNLVNRVPQGKAFIYRIMGPGEEYLAHLGEKGASMAAPSPSVTRPNRKGRKANRARVTSSRTEGNPAKKPSTRASSSGSHKLGPKTAVMGLLGADFFSTPKTGPQVQEYLQSKRGYTIGIAQLRLVMLRLVRDGVLERSQNADGHYEYKKP